MKKVLSLMLAITMLFSIAAGTGLTAEAATVGKVSGLSVSAKGSDYVKLKWKKVKKATGYQVYYSTNNKKFKIAKTIKKNKTVSAKITGLKAGKKYYFKVRALRGKSKGKFSKVVSATTSALGNLNIKNAKTSYYYRPKANSSGGYQSILFSFDYINADGFECRWYYDDTHYNEGKVRNNMKSPKYIVSFGATVKFKIRAYKKNSGKVQYGNWYVIDAHDVRNMKSVSETEWNNISNGYQLFMTFD